MRNGPLNKSLHTQMYELVAKCILHTDDRISYELKPNSQGHNDLIVNLDKQSINLSTLAKKTNFNHIQLSDQDSAVFLNKAPQFDDFLTLLNPNTYGIMHSKYQDLSYGEIKAIQNYSGSAYYQINTLLYGHAENLKGYTDSDISTNSEMTILNTAFLSSGLNKIAPELEPQDTYRGESRINHEEIQHRIMLIQSDDGISKQPAFMSTSAEEWVGEGFSNGTMITFEFPYGKDISSLSYFEGEQEYLILPSKILWTGYECRDGVYYFKAKVVEPLDENADTPTAQEIKQFQDLLDFARDNGVDTDFITHFNRKEFLKNTDQTITLEEVLSPQDGILDHDSTCSVYNNEFQAEDPIQIYDLFDSLPLIEAF